MRELVQRFSKATLLAEAVEDLAQILKELAQLFVGSRRGLQRLLEGAAFNPGHCHETDAKLNTSESQTLLHRLPNDRHKIIRQPR